MSPYILFSDAKPEGDPESLEKPTSDEWHLFMSAVGEAVAMWQLVEIAVIFLFLDAVKGTDKRATSAAFHSIAGFRNRLDMTDAALRQVIKEPSEIEEWEKTYKRLLKKSRRRNAIAHSVVGFDPKENAGKRLFLVDGLVDPKKNPVGAIAGGARIYRKELLEMRDSFARVQTIALGFWALAFRK